LDSLAGNMKDMPVRVQIEYHYGYAKLGMGEGYTQRMLAQEFSALAHNDWNFFARTIDGIIRLCQDNIVRKPPNSLDRMHASLPKQVAYNQRILSAENEIAGINCDIASFSRRCPPTHPNQSSFASTQASLSKDTSSTLEANSGFKVTAK
jgi:hypothetical protein